MVINITYLLIPPLISDKINKTINMKNSILAIPADVPAIPPNPKTPAMIAMITNVTVHLNIIILV
jgi:hypothetical protein